jgi:F-type H+-transporting ATPase subunit epsilon
MKINFKIVTPEKTVFESEIDQATLPVADGEVTILPNHRSYIAALKAGEIDLKKEGEEIIMATSGGFIEFNDNNLVVLADTAERAEEIDLKRAEEAKAKAEQAMKEKDNMDNADYARVAAAIEKEMARLRVGRKHYTKRGVNIEQPLDSV